MSVRQPEDHKRHLQPQRPPEEDERLEDLEPDEDEAAEVHGGMCRCAWCAYTAN